MRASTALVVSALAMACHRRGATVRAQVSPLAQPRRAPHAWARAGDLALCAQGTCLTVAASPDLAGHRPLRGAVLDARPDARDEPDPLLWWRPAFVDAQGRAHVAVADRVEAARCAGGARGVTTSATVDGVTLATRLCPRGGGRFRAVTTATGLPEGARLADEINPGSASVFVRGRGEGWEGEVASRFVALAERGVALTFTSRVEAVARRRLVHIARETFPAPLLWIAPSSPFERDLAVRAGDAVDALAAATPEAAQAFELDAPEARGGTLELLDADGVALQAPFAGPRRRVSLPAPFALRVRVRDARGVPSDEVDLRAAPTTVRLAPRPSGTLRVEVRDADEAPMPARVILRALDGATQPFLRPSRGDAAERSAYLVDGRAEVRLAAGRYRVVVTRGPAWTRAAEELTITADTTTTLARRLSRVVPRAPWVAGDFHLHAEPSPDSRVTLADRVASLACNGVEVAAATDHNRVTDYRDAVRARGLEGRLAVIAGDEVTSAGRALWGHFNAFPLPVADGAPDDVVPAYWERRPADIFRAARAQGASVLMVNHARMPPSIGYFDLAGLDARTGAASADFSDDFDALEAFNGIWLATPARVREGVVDLVGLARRGRRVAAMGNSDSHRLGHEEAGYPCTWVRVAPGPADTLAARVVAGVRAGATTVSSGPFVELEVYGRGPGEVASPPRVATPFQPGVDTSEPVPEVTVHVRVTAPAWVPVEHVEVWIDDRVVLRRDVTTPAVDGVRYEADHVFPLTRDAVLLAWADADTPLPDVLPDGDERAIGFSGPVWYDHDGDGRVVVPPRGADGASP